MSIRCSSTSPKVRRSGDCGGHLSTVNGHVQETSLRGSGVVNRKTVLLESFIKRVGRGQRQYSGWLLCLTNAPLVLRRTKWGNIPQTTSFDDTCELQPQFPGLSWQEQHLMLSSAAVVHPLQGSTCCAFIDAFLHTLVATSGYLSYCWLTFSSKLCGHSLISGINKTFLPRDMPLTSYFLFFGYFSSQSPKSPFLLWWLVLTSWDGVHTKVAGEKPANSMFANCLHYCCLECFSFKRGSRLLEKSSIYWEMFTVYKSRADESKTI